MIKWIKNKIYKWKHRSKFRKWMKFLNYIHIFTIVKPDKHIKLKLRSYKLVQIWYYCCLMACTDLYQKSFCAEHRKDGAVELQFTRDFLVDKMSEKDIIVIDSLRVSGEDTAGDVIYYYARKHFDHYRKIMNLGGKERLSFAERFYMLLFVYWFRYGISSIYNLGFEVKKPYGKYIPISYHGKIFNSIDAFEFITFDHKVEMFLWNKLVNEFRPDYKGVDVSDILKSINDNTWRIEYNDEHTVLTQKDKPKTPIPVGPEPPALF